MLSYPNKISFGIYSLIFLTFFFTLILTSTGFLVNIPLSKLHFPASVFLGLVTTFFLVGKKEVKSFLISTFICVVTSILCFYVSIYFYDFSWDGMAYHQDTIVILANGWNPLQGSSGSVFSEWVDPYQKGVEYIQAAIYLFTGKIESGKLYNLLLFVATFLILTDALKIYIKPVFTRFSLAFLSVCCPVVLVQIFTYYIDFTYYLLTLGVICSLVLVFKFNTKKFYFLFIATSVLICCIKFSTVPTFVIICSATIFYIFWQKKKEFLKPIFISFSSIFLLCVITNYNPFITNLSEGKHIFHPLMGKEKLDIMKYNAPPYIYGKDRLEKFYLSTISVVSNSYQTIDGIPANKDSKIPFSIKEGEIEKLKIADVRLSGFGVFFSGILIITIIILMSIPLIYFFDKKRDLKEHKEFFVSIYFIIGVLMVSIIINPEMWWARYVPQLWIIPILSLVMVWKINIYYLRTLKFLLFFSMLFNVLIHGLQVIDFEFNASENVRDLLSDLKEADEKIMIEEKFFVNIHKRLEENDIEFIREKMKGDYFYMPESFGNVKMQKISNIERLDTLQLKDIADRNELTLYDFLKKYYNETIIIVGKDEASQGLSPEEMGKIKQDFGLNIKDLKFRGSYVAVISKGKVVFEEIKNDKSIEISNNPTLKKLGINQISSAGYTVGNFSSIRMNSSELSLNKRGLNIVLLKDVNHPYLLNMDSFQSNKIDSIVYKAVFKNEK